MLATVKLISLTASLPQIEALHTPDGKNGAGLRSLCNLLAIELASQLLRIKRHTDLKAALHYVTVDTTAGSRSVAMLESWSIAAWAAGLQTSRLSPEKQEAATLLKQHAYQAIQRAFEAESAPPQAESEQADYWTASDPFQLLLAGISGLQQSFAGLERRVNLLEVMQTPRRYGSTGGLSAYQIGQVYLLLRLLRDTTGVSLEETEQRLARAFGVAHLTNIDAAQWEALITKVHTLFQQ